MMHDNDVLINNDTTAHTVHKKDYIIILILFIINLLNYMERVTIAGVLEDMKKYYHLNHKQVGMVQMVFIISYMITSPIFGYLGDRYNRKNIILCGVAFWSVFAFASSFVKSDKFFLFVILRSLVGIGEASYSTVVPTIISDLFTGVLRTKVITVFYVAIPIGSGLGYIIGSVIAKAFNKWQFALRYTPVLGLVCVILLLFFVKEPTRGKADGGTHLAPSTWREDVRQLTKNRSFIFICFGFTAVCFCTGSLSWWTVYYLNCGIDALAQTPGDYKKYSISIIFGAITIVAGLIGMIIGSGTGMRLRKRWPESDTIVCAFGMTCAAPLIVVFLALAKNHVIVSFLFIFVAETLLALNWALVTDITLSIVIPTRRATAMAYQMILSHAFGDAFSPYIIGVISLALRHRLTIAYSELESEYLGLQYSLYLNAFIAVFGGALFLWCSFYITNDRRNAIELTEESRTLYEPIGNPYTPDDLIVCSGSSLQSPASVIFLYIPFVITEIMIDSGGFIFHRCDGHILTVPNHF